MELDKNKIPKHVAIIMDGNGRWAKKQGKLRVQGHKAGVKSVRRITEYAGNIGVKHLTLYTFSTENWNRPKLEVHALMSLLVDTMNQEIAELHKNGIRLTTIGDISRLPVKSYESLKEGMELTKNNTNLNLHLALNYSARWEITEMVKKVAALTKEGLPPDNITEATINQNLETAGIPDPELVIRTSGEFRISNFLLWQIAYSELYFTDVLWPDFTEEHFKEAIIDYQNRERRFGKISEQIS